MNNRRYNYIEINQPIGTMYLVKLPASKVAEISTIETRKVYNGNNIPEYRGIQRKLEKSRVDSIATYCESKEAMFPTPIILSAPSDKFIINEVNKTIEIPSEEVYCSIIDGQHRIEGLKKSGLIDNFELFVEFVFDTDPSRDAYLFSIINGNQKPVSKSLIYDLYGVSKARTVEKMCNKVMRELNTNINSAMLGKIKMLGYKDEFSLEGVVSQARLIDELIKYITDNPQKDNYDIEVGNYLRELDEKYIFRRFFIENDVTSLININLDFFNAWISQVKKAGEKDSILEKSIGLSAAYRLLLLIYKPEVCYESILEKIIPNFINLGLHKKTYSSSESGFKILFYSFVKVGCEYGAFNEEGLRDILSERNINAINAIDLKNIN